MKIFVTKFFAINATTGELNEWQGQHVKAPSLKLAKTWCEKNAGYLTVIGELIAEIPCEKDFTPNFEKEIDFKKINEN